MAGPREVDPRKTRRALAKLRRAVAKADAKDSDGAAGDGGEPSAAGLTAWEREFAESLETRLTQYGSAFRDPTKGALEEPLSLRQAAKLRELAGKGAKKDRASPAKTPARRRKGFGARGRGPRVRQIDEDFEPES